MLKEKRYSGCLHPMVMMPDGHTVNGKVKYKMVGPAADGALSFDPLAKVVPCGHCINCRLAYSRKWADRLILESLYHDESWFVTLTYNDFFIPEVGMIDENTGEFVRHYSLFKRDVQLFLKRFREMVDYPIRFYCAGEYGSKTFRPHYHLIIFGLKLEDLKDKDGRPDLYGDNVGRSGYDLYRSRLLERAWSKVVCDRVWPIGNVVVAPVNWKTCAYVARYVTKKIANGNDDVYQKLGIAPPFSTCSRKPGIAYQYYLDHPDFAEKQKMFYGTEDGSKQINYPLYFLNHLEVDNVELYAKIKEDRAKASKISWRNLHRQYDSVTNFLKIEEDKAKSVDKMLIREEI